MRPVSKLANLFQYNTIWDPESPEQPVWPYQIRRALWLEPTWRQLQFDLRYQQREKRFACQDRSSCHLASAYLSLVTSGTPVIRTDSVFSTVSQWETPFLKSIGSRCPTNVSGLVYSIFSQCL